MLIAELIASELEAIYGIKPSYQFEYEPHWLTCLPSGLVLEKYRSIISKSYALLNANRFELFKQLALKDRLGQQSYDIWFDAPFDFAVEFDESQHFNQFRLTTLSLYNDIPVGFNLEYYKNLNEKIAKPSTSGFCKLKTKLPFFPELLEGEKQDNRTRERAFRDMLKDLSPIALNYNPTVRVPYHITNKKINDFTKTHLTNISNYLNDNQLLNDLI